MKSKRLPLYLLLITTALSTSSILGAENRALWVSFNSSSKVSIRNIQYIQRNDLFCLCLTEDHFTKAKETLGIEKSYKELSTTDIKKILNKVFQFTNNPEYRCTFIYTDNKRKKTFKDNENPLGAHAKYVQEVHQENLKKYYKGLIENNEQQIKANGSSSTNNKFHEIAIESYNKKIKEVNNNIPTDFGDYVKGERFPLGQNQQNGYDYALHVDVTISIAEEKQIVGSLS